MTNPLEYLVPEADAVEANEGLANRERRELLIARRCGRSLGIYANQTEGIIVWKAPAPLPRAASAICGLVSVRGHMFTVIDPRSLAGVDGLERPSPASFIVLLSGPDQLALAVERVTSITEIFVDEIQPPNIPSKDALVLGHWNNGTETVTILRSELIFNAACGEVESTP